MVNFTKTRQMLKGNIHSIPLGVDFGIMPLFMYINRLKEKAQH